MSESGSVLPVQLPHDDSLVTVSRSEYQRLVDENRQLIGSIKKTSAEAGRRRIHARALAEDLAKLTLEVRALSKGIIEFMEAA